MLFGLLPYFQKWVNKRSIVLISGHNSLWVTVCDAMTVFVFEILCLLFITTGLHLSHCLLCSEIISHVITWIFPFKNFKANYCNSMYVELFHWIRFFFLYPFSHCNVKSWHVATLPFLKQRWDISVYFCLCPTVF